MSGNRLSDEQVPEDAVRIASTPTSMAIDGDPTTGEVRDLLAEHVPLSLLADLASPDGPPSGAIMADEGLPDDEWWLPEDERPTS